MRILPTCAASAAPILLALAACNAPPASDNRAGGAESPALPRPSAARAPSPSAAALAPAVAATQAGNAARRCGWLVNPTPGNWWFYDRDGEWILASQGSEGAPGMDDMPDMSTAGWVETNGHYGYGCACMTLAYDPASRQVTRIADPRPKPPKQCRADKRLPRP